MIKKYHNHKLHTNPWHREEEPHYNHETRGRQTKQSNHKSSDIFVLTSQMREENVDVVCDMPLRNDTGEVSKAHDAKQNARTEHYEMLMNVELMWDPKHLSNENASRMPAHPNHYWHSEEGHLKDDVGQSHKPIKHSGGKYQGSRWYVCHRIFFVMQGLNWMGAQFHFLPLQGRGWCSGKRQLSRPQADLTGHQDPIEDIQWPQKRCILMTHSSALSQKETLQMQSLWFGGLQEKYLVVSKRLYMTFLDLEKAFDRVPRNIFWWTLRILGVEDWIVQLVQGTYDHKTDLQYQTKRFGHRMVKIPTCKVWAPRP